MTIILFYRQENQRDQVIFLRSHSLEVLEPTFEVRFSESKSRSLSTPPKLHILDYYSWLSSLTIDNDFNQVWVTVNYLLSHIGIVVEILI